MPPEIIFNEESEEFELYWDEVDWGVSRDISFVDVEYTSNTIVISFECE